ncbi:MAG: hypothetical protein Q9191_007044, partial [Dirinaria sp. TL-2023a]
MLDTVVLIKVGPEKTEFGIHKGVLCNASPFFRAALEGGFKETVEQTLELPEAAVDAFKLFQFWLYSRRFEKPSAYADTEETWTSFVQLYIFAEVHGMPELQNDVMDILCALFELGYPFDWSAITDVYKDCPSNSPLRRVIVDMCVRLPLSKAGWFQEDVLSSYPIEWLRDVILAQDYLLTYGLKITDPKGKDYHVKVEPEE